MKIFAALIQLLCIVIFWANAMYVDIEFLKEFFKNRNAALMLNNCWSYAKNKVLLKEFALLPKLAPIGFYKDFNDINSLKKWSNNDYFVLDMRDCASSDRILYQLNESNIFVYPLKYVLLVENVDFPEFSEKLNNYMILPSCEIVIAVFEGEKALLYQPYKVGKINDLTWESYGNCSLEGSLFEYYWDIPTPQRRVNLKRANLVVGLVIFNNDTLNHLTDYRYPDIDTFTKQDFEPMMCVCQYMNINYSFLIVDNYGYVDPETGIFSGLVREIQIGNADVSAGSIFFTEDRYGAVDLLKQGNPHPIRFIVRKPSTSYIKNIFFITFNVNVWVASIVVLTISSVFVRIILNWEVGHKQRVKQDKYSLSDITLIALEVVCQQGTTTEPQSYAGRIIAVILFGAFMFIYVSYSANIVVLLQSTTQLNNIQELLDSRIEAGGERIHYMKNYFEAVKKGPLKQLYEKKIYPNQYFPLDVGMRKVQKGNFAYHLSLQSAYTYILANFTNHEICGLQELAGYIEENRGYIAVPKHSPYKDLFKVVILKVDEFGLQRRTNLRILMAPKCFSQAASFTTVGFYDCDRVIWVWVIGVGLALFVFMLEKLHEKLARKVEIKIRNNFNTKGGTFIN